MDRHNTDVTLPKHHAWLARLDHSHEPQRRDVVSLACADHVDMDGGDIHPRHISTQDIQPHGMDAAVYAARAFQAFTPSAFTVNLWKNLVPAICTT